MKNQAKPKIAVIGAGWSGLAAAVNLCGKTDVTLFEAGKTAGGRARALNADKGGFAFLDNGQHILIGAYRGVRTLMNRIGANSKEAFLHLPLQWHLADGLQFQTGILPAPFHIVAGVLRGKNMTLADKTGLLLQMSNLQKRRPEAPDISVAQWLREQDVSRRQLSDFWQPLVFGALNTPLETASLNILCNVLRDGIWSDKQAGEYWLPKQDLGRTVAGPALGFLKKHHSVLRLGERAGVLECLSENRVAVNGQIFDGAILAVAPYHAQNLLPQDTPEAFRQALACCRYHAITTVYLRYAEAPNLPAALTGFAEGYAQWIIDRNRLGCGTNELAAVVSVSEQHGLSGGEWAEKIHADVLRAAPHLGEPLETRVITEKRATTAAEVGRTIPDCAWLHHQNIYPAGDYLHPRYPATLEAAVQSGQQAAALLLNRFELDK